MDEHTAKYAPDCIRKPDHFFRYADECADPETGEVEVKHLPTGFMLVDRSVLETLKEGSPSFLMKANESAEELRYWDMFPAGVIGGRYETEDWFFCSIAREAGHPAYLNTRVIVDHWGRFNYCLPRSVGFAAAPEPEQPK